MAQDLLLEIGCEELPATFVASAVEAMPRLFTAKLKELRLTHGTVRATGTPRRLALMVEAVASEQPDLDEEVLGPPARVAFDDAGKLTRAAEAFAQKQGIDPATLARKTTDKGEYLVGRRAEKGRPAIELLPAALEKLCGEIPFRKSMRWSDGEVAFGRPVRWLLALLGERVVPFDFARLSSGRVTRGHRFLSPKEIVLQAPGDYVGALMQAHVVVDLESRRRTMVERLHAAAKSANATLIEDEFLVEENLSLVEDPSIVVGGFEERFLALPERVILDVAKGHQRYFGMRDASGKLAPAYLAVVGTAENPANVRRGNDRVMRARLADAKFFYDEDLKTPLSGRLAALDGVVFHQRLGTIGDKVRRLAPLVRSLGSLLGVAAGEIEDAVEASQLCKCDLVTLMVGELPELQGEMGRVYALAQGVKPAVAQAIDEHYWPRGADDATAPGVVGALVALADRLDTLTGCFACGLVPTGTADPLALRRAALGILRTLLDRNWDLDLAAALRVAYAGFASVKLDEAEAATTDKLLAFLKLRLRGLLTAQLPNDVVDAALAVGAERPVDARSRAQAVAELAPELRTVIGEVFKRAGNIAKDAPQGAPVAPASLSAEVAPAETALFAAFETLSTELAAGQGDYHRALQGIGAFAPTLATFFTEVFVMVDDQAIRGNRLQLMRALQEQCSRLADFNVLGKV